ncbi:MAG: hypothetical protein R3202_07540, partial [Candidatus Competibacterales bacterium]|nr:hypothetical protein [Candidatus Competibacterales bacterium]
MTISTDRSQEEVPLEEKIAFLSSPAAYAAAVGTVTRRETHMSWVFLAGDRAYKLRKPVRYPFLDFSTREAREADCRAEIRLNRRLAPAVYLGLARLTRDADGRLALDGEGQTVDWLVRMRRLPEDGMLDHAIGRGTVTEASIERLAAVLARFYRALDPVRVALGDYLAGFVHQQYQNRALLSDPRLAPAAVEWAPVLDGLDALLARAPQLLAARARTGRIVEG